MTAYTERVTCDGVAFTATLRLHGKIIGTVRNDGHSGPDTCYATDELTAARQTAALEEFAAQCTATNGEACNLESVLADLVSEYQTSRDITRPTRRGHVLLRKMQDGKDDDGPIGAAVEVVATEATPRIAADRPRLRSYLLGTRALAPSVLAWWQIWDADTRRWNDLTDRPAHLNAGGLQIREP